MTVRAKLHLDSITEYAGGHAKTLNFSARYDESIPEDRRFAKATPSGTLVLYVDNPEAMKHFVAGTSYYVDLTPAPLPAGTGG